MKQFPLLRWLILAALLDWLITRTLARMAIFMPKSPPILLAYQGLIFIGQFASVFAVVLTWLAWVWLICKLWKNGFGGITFLSSLLLGISLFSLLIPPTPWTLVGFHTITLMLIGWFGYQIAVRIHSLSDGGMMIPVFALSFSTLYLLGQTSHLLLSDYVSQKPVSFLYHVGEALAVLSPIALLWSMHAVLPAVFRKQSYWTLLPLAALTGIYWFNPSMTGILAIWSLGLTLFLPWPLYGFSLWAWLLGLAAGKGNDAPFSTALILFAAAGYAPQLSTQIFWGLIALFLLQESMDALPVSTFTPEITEKNSAPASTEKMVNTYLFDSGRNLPV